jgi:hypothetical protein
MVFDADTFTGGLPAAGFPDSIPQFAPLKNNPIFLNDALISPKEVPLDGLDCRKCTFEDAPFIYAGGPFNLEDSKFKGTFTVDFVGAAANTLALVDFMQHVSNGSREIPAAPNKAVQRRSTASKPMTQLTAKAPFIGK